MNGGAIPRDHGFPLRVVVPGHVAARQVKWVEKIIVSADESDSHWQQEDYKGFCPGAPLHCPCKDATPGWSQAKIQVNILHSHPVAAAVVLESVCGQTQSYTSVHAGNCMRVSADARNTAADEDWSNLDWSKAPAIQEMPITSAILHTNTEGTVLAGSKSLPLKGYAVAGGGRDVVRVDVSIDGGNSWTPAQLKAYPDGQEPGYHRAWAWRHWEVRVSCPVHQCAATSMRELA